MQATYRVFQPLQDTILEVDDEQDAMTELMDAFNVDGIMSMDTTIDPTIVITAVPSDNPSLGPSSAPSLLPSKAPSIQPSSAPTTFTPAPTESTMPSISPSVSQAPSPSEPTTSAPSAAPTVFPSATPSTVPTARPTFSPSNFPSSPPSGGIKGITTIVPTDRPSTTPSALPTSGPSASPSSAPTFSPSSEPSKSPTGTPSASPSAFPTPTPTVVGCPGVSAEARRNQILAILQGATAVQDPTVLADTSTSEGQATEWLLNGDALKICPDDPKIVQRWVLAVMYFSTNGNDWDQCSDNLLADDDCGNEEPFLGKQRFLSGFNECEWAGVFCNEELCVTEIEFELQQLVRYPYRDGALDPFGSLGNGTRHVDRNNSDRDRIHDQPALFGSRFQPTDFHC
ncbi:receptor-like protein kinase [Seminavis robusta]|uniref:Receptor-like protein kinase n=1 Tax=Seminavis robusta TaxID=568900 RepID=A0A9N8DXM8_9STRA|nr:receptor-like protein kinase [Seminavis robusta]|eukprot:Sro349_g123610.1 receptor-like protein kinase (398) ;mRNA; f:70892-72254